MIGPDDMIGWKEVATGGAVILSGLVAFTVNVFTRRLDEHEKQDNERFSKLFDGQGDISEKIGTGFRGLDQTINEIHVKLLERINDVQQSHQRRSPGDGNV